MREHKKCTKNIQINSSSPCNNTSESNQARVGAGLECCEKVIV